MYSIPVACEKDEKSECSRVRKSGRMCESFVNSIHCLVPNLTYCVQGLSCPGFVVSRVCLSRECPCTV
jgi:hypothetical protein